MRQINHIVLHCSATSKDATVDSIKRFWKEDLKWKSVGYHYIVDAKGEVTNLAPDASVTNGVRGNNSDTIHVCYIGGITADGKASDTRTEAQKESLIHVLQNLTVKYPDADILGHRDFSPDVDGSGTIEPDEWIKMCPCFDAQKEYSLI